MVIDTYSRTARPAMRTIATEPYPMTPLTIPDGLGPVPTSSGFATDRCGTLFRRSHTVNYTSGQLNISNGVQWPASELRA